MHSTFCRSRYPFGSFVPVKPPPLAPGWVGEASPCFALCYCRRIGGCGQEESSPDSCKLISDTRITNLKYKERHSSNKSRLRTSGRPWTFPFPLIQYLPFDMAASVNSPLPTKRSSVVIPPIYSPPPVESPTRRHHSVPSFLSSTYPNDTTRRDSTGPYSFPPRPVFSGGGTSCSVASSKTGGLHSRTLSVEFLVAHDRSSKATTRPPPMLQLQSESFWSGFGLCFALVVGPDDDIPRRSLVGRLDKGTSCPSVFA
jgi:hypothetical protein